MMNSLAMRLSVMADSSGAVTAMHNYVSPTIRTLCVVASLACVLFIVHAGYLYMTSAGKPDTLAYAKRVLRNALLGLVIVLGAVTLTSILSGAYGQPAGGAEAMLPHLQAIPPDHVNNGLVEVLIKAITGLLNNIIQAVATPFLAALTFFTSTTPLMATNPSVFNLWVATVGVTDVLFVLILALIGFHVMSAASLGFDEIEIKHLLPRIVLVFMLINTSIFVIDGVIGLSNALIKAIENVGGASSVWSTLTSVVKNTSGQSVAALLLMVSFLIFSVILLVYYVGRIVTLYIGAVLSPIVLVVWLLPGFRDFSETAIKTYVATIFVLFVHVTILLLAASLFTGMATVGPNQVPDTLMAMIVGLATVLTLLKTQSVMTQFSYVSIGSRNTRMLGGLFMNGVSYMTGKATMPVGSGSAQTSNSVTGSGGGKGRSSHTWRPLPQLSTTNSEVRVTRIPQASQEKVHQVAPNPPPQTQRGKDTSV